MEQKAITVTSTAQGAINSSSLADLNSELSYGWQVVSITPVPISAGGICDVNGYVQSNSMTGDFLVILQK